MPETYSVNQETRLCLRPGLPAHAPGQCAEAGGEEAAKLPGGGGQAVGSAALSLLEGGLPVLADRWVAGVQADDLVVVPYRLVRLAQVAVQIRSVAEGVDVVRVEGDGPPEITARLRHH